MLKNFFPDNICDIEKNAVYLSYIIKSSGYDKMMIVLSLLPVPFLCVMICVTESFSLSDLYCKKMFTEQTIILTE